MGVRELMAGSGAPNEVGIELHEEGLPVEPEAELLAVEEP